MTWNIGLRDTSSSTAQMRWEIHSSQGQIGLLPGKGKTNNQTRNRKQEQKTGTENP